MVDWLVEHLALVMFVTMFFVIFVGFPVAFVLGGTALLFATVAWHFGLLPFVSLSNIVVRVWGGVASDPILVSIPMFIFMGAILERSGSAQDMLRAMETLLGRVPGGLAIAVMVMGTILAAPIGVVGAAVVMLSVISLPQLLASGYDKGLALGTIASAGTLGILLPPAIMLVVMAEMLTVSAGALFAAAAFPGLLLPLLYVVYIFVAALLDPTRAPRMTRSIGDGGRWRFWGPILRGLLPMTFLVVFVLGSIFAGWATATESAAIGVLGAMIIAAINGRFSLGMLSEAMWNSCRANAMIFLLFIGATGFSYVFRALGGDDLLIGLMASFGIDTKWEILAFVMILIFLLGFPFEWIEICLIVLPIFYPILAKLDFSDHLGDASYFMVWFATLVAVNLQTSFMTPPFGSTLFYLKGTVPPGISMSVVFRGMYPFVALQIVGLVLCIVFPEIALWLPRITGMLD